MSAQANVRPGLPALAIASAREFRPSLARLRAWVEERDYAGWEPYDLLNSPVLPKLFSRSPLDWLTIQAGKRIGSPALRRLLRVPPSKNPKALALFISGYCDLARAGEDTHAQVQYLEAELDRLRSPNEQDYCWGYDWPYVSLRGIKMPAFSPNAIATVASGQAMLDINELFGDYRSLERAKSVGKFIITRLNRPVDLPEMLCFSYSPSSQSRIYNSSALCCAFLARLGRILHSDEYLAIARRGMQYLAAGQRSDGSWPYGEGRWQRWIDSFHTGFNLSAIREYKLATDDHSFDDVLTAGYDFYIHSFFRADGAPKYYPTSTYPIDIHSCSQALIVLGDFAPHDSFARELAEKVMRWTERNLQSPEGFFYYQQHRLWVNRVPYMRWAQAWMFRASAHAHLKICSKAS